MPRSESAQLNIRSRFARERVAVLARRTGMTATQIVEEALRAYHPPPDEEPPPGRLIRKGPLLVMPAQGRPITLEDVNASIDQDRDERG